MFHHLFSVTTHDAVFNNLYFIIYTVRIPLHIIVLPLLLNATKHGHCCFRNIPWYKLLFLDLLSILGPIAYGIPGTNNVITKGETSLEKSKQQHYVQVDINKVTRNHTPQKSPTTKESPRGAIYSPDTGQSSTTMIKHLNSSINGPI